MAFFDWLLGRQQTEQKAIEGFTAQPSAGLMSYILTAQRSNLTSGSYVEWVEKAYKQNPTVNGALNLIMNTLTEAPLCVLDPETGEKLEDHLSQQVLDHINPRDTQNSFLKRLLLDMYLGDVGYIEKVFSRRGNQVVEMATLRPDKVKLTTNDFGIITQYQYTVGGKELVLDPKQVIPIQFIDPLDPFKGFSPLKGLAYPIDLSNSQNKHSLALFNNYGVPAMLLKVSDAYDDYELDRLRKGWEQRHKGENAGGVGTVRGDVEIEQLGYSLKDLDFNALAVLEESRILAALRVPPAVYGSVSGQQSSTYNNVKEAQKTFWQQCIIPLQTMIEDALNKDEDLTDGGRVQIKFDRSDIDALSQDRTEATNRASIMYRDGLVTLNEARAEVDLDETEEGDEFKAAPEPMGLFGAPDEQEPDEQPEEEKVEEEEKQAESVPETKAGSTDDTEDLETKQRFDSDYTRTLNAALEREALAQSFLAKGYALSRKLLLKQVNDVLTLIGDKGNKAIKSFEKNRLETGLGDAHEVWKSEAREAFKETMGPLYGKAYETAGLNITAEFNIRAPQLDSLINNYSTKFAHGMTETTRKQMSKLIREHFDGNLPLGKLAEAVQELGETYEESRALTIARTETSVIVNDAALNAYRDTGVVEGLEWNAILDSRTSEICDSLNGKIVSISSNFASDDNPIVLHNGQTVDLSYYGGQLQTPPAHPNCRSFLAPVVLQRAYEDAAVIVKTREEVEAALSEEMYKLFIGEECNCGQEESTPRCTDRDQAGGPEGTDPRD